MELAPKSELFFVFPRGLKIILCSFTLNFQAQILQRLSRNIGYMGLSQAANYLLPLVTLPYITRVVGPSNYGLIEFASVTTVYFSALVSYGFVFTATRKVAELQNRYNRISTIYSVVQQTKLILLVLAALSFAILLLTVPQYRNELRLMLCAFPFVIGWALYPDFLFQGRQDLGVIALANLLVKSLGAVLIFVLLQEPEQFYFVLAINSSTQLAAAAVTILYARKKYPWLKFSWQRWRLVKAYLFSGFYMFASMFFTRLYVFGSILFLGFLLPPAQLGLFAAALKLITVAQNFLVMPLGNSLYPHLSNLLKTDSSKYLSERKRFRNYLIAAGALAALVTVVGKDLLIGLFFGEDYADAAPLLALMAPVFIFTAIGHFSLKQGLMVLKADKENLSAVLITGALSVILNYLLIQWQGLYGAAWAKIGLELLLAALGVLYFKKALAKRGLTKVAA